MTKYIKIALIEDNPGDVRLIEECLKENTPMNLHLHHFNSLTEALEKIKNQNFDVILLDLNLPDSFGMNTINKIIKVKKEIPIVALTTISEESLAVDALKKGIQDYIVKEYLDRYNLVRAINHAIERKKIENAFIEKDREINELYLELERKFYEKSRELIKSKSKFESLELEFETVLDAIPAMIFYKDVNNNILKVNRFFADSHRSKKNDFEGKSCFELYPTVLAQKYWRDDLEVIKTRRPKEEIEELWEKDGIKKWFLTNKIPYINEKGKVIGIMGISIDITKRKSIEQDLKKSEKEYRTLVETSQEGIWSIDENAQTTFVNKKMTEILGYTKIEMIGKQLSEFIDPSFKEQVNYYLKRRKKGIRETHDSQFIKKNGLKLHAKVKTDPIFDEKGEYKGAFAYISDISQQVIAERALKKSQKLFEKTINSIPDALFILDSKNPPIIQNCNPGVMKIFGYTPEEIIGKDFTICHIDLFSYNHFQQIIYSEIRRIGLIRNLTFKMKRKNGDIFPSEHTIFPLYNEGGEPSGWVNYIRDLTDIKEAEKKSEELEKLRNNFVYRASHELKTPLTAIYGASQLLNSDLKSLSWTRVEKLIEVISDGAKRLKELIEKLLDLSKIESNQLKLDYKMGDLIPIIHEVIQYLDFMMNQRQISLEINLPDKILIRFDEFRIKQLFVNIISNAINYTPPKGEIKIRLENNVNHVQLIIKDTGIGFTHEEQQKIFKRFGKIERYGEGFEIITEGSGLGLYISREIVLKHSGEIWIESEGRNKGSEVHIRFPKL